MEGKDESLCAMYFGMSCAFFALKYLSEQQSDSKKCDLLHKLQAAEREITELKRRRSEDAKANEKVVSIYAVQKQNWFTERRKLQQEIGGLMNDMSFLNKRKNDTVSDLNRKLQDKELLMKSKDKMLVEEDKKRKELEEKVKSMEVMFEELREATNREAQDRSSELLKHKTAFIELVSNQRQLEAELGRALRQVEATEQQLDIVFKEKEEAVLMVQEMYMEIEKMRRDSGKKDKILSAMSRKSKLNLVDQMHLKEVRLNKPKRKKAGVETEKWWTISGSRNARCTLRNLLSTQASSKLEADEVLSEQKEMVDVDLDDAEVQIEHDHDSFPRENKEFGEDEWVHLETVKYQTAVKQQHQLELEDFAQQMQLKNDKLEGYRWQLLRSELESKKLKNQIEGFNKDMSQLQDDHLKIESLLLDREEELKTLKDQIALKSNNFSNETIEEKEGLEQEAATMNKVINKPMLKMDLHALGVSYKIKRLNQQLLMLARLTGKQESVEVKGKDEPGRTRMKGFLLLLSLLDKQVSRYQSLQEKTDDLNKRMGDKELHITQGVSVSRSARTKEDTKALEVFLEETFQLQRFIVATGQKLMEIQTKIGPGFIGISEDLDVSASFDMNKFAETIRTLLKDVQRGLEVRTSRIIGDLEGTLACDGIHSWK